ncbi:MAG: SDR family NAD(P)-dependent oxidoreductase, partial [Candidatus Bipolaricaulaceae bacterium]
LGAALPVTLILDPGMFDLPLWNRIEFVHTRDVGLAIARGISSCEIWGKTLNVGGGKSCQLYYRDVVQGVLQALGIGMLPEEAFLDRDFSTDWLDTEESQRILGFQTRTFEDYIQDMLKVVGWRRFVIKAFRPLVRSFLLSRSLPYRRAHSPFREKVAVVTGASRRIGREIALKLGEEGLKVILVSRSAQALESLREEIERRGGQAYVFPCDLTREEERVRLWEFLKESFPGVDVLVNNAGFGWYGYLEEMPWDLAREMVELNALSPLHLTRLLLPQMNKGGRIVNISSISAEIPSQGVALYSATKSFLSSLSTALHRELRGRIAVSSLKLGPVDTDFFERIPGQAGLKIPGKVFPLKPEKVAQRVWVLLNRPQRQAYFPRWLRVIPVLEFTFGWLFDALGPLLLRRQLSRVRSPRT